MKQDVKYIGVLVALLFMAGSLPAFQTFIQNESLNNDPVAETGSALFSFFGLSSSSPVQRGGDEQRPQLQKPPAIPPQDVVTLLYKNGYISADKLDAARKLVSSLQQGNSKGNGDSDRNPCGLLGGIPSTTPMGTLPQTSSGQRPPCRPAFPGGDGHNSSSTPPHPIMMSSTTWRMMGNDQTPLRR